MEDPQVFARQIKELATVTPQDKLLMQKQKKGQLRIGDIIAIKFKEEIIMSEIEREKKEKKYNALEDLPPIKQKRNRNLV